MGLGHELNAASVSWVSGWLHWTGTWQQNVTLSQSWLDLWIAVHKWHSVWLGSRESVYLLHDHRWDYKLNTVLWELSRFWGNREIMGKTSWWWTQCCSSQVLRGKQSIHTNVWMSANFLTILDFCFSFLFSFLPPHHRFLEVNILLTQTQESNFR